MGDITSGLAAQMALKESDVNNIPLCFDHCMILALKHKYIS